MNKTMIIFLRKLLMCGLLVILSHLALVFLVTNAGVEAKFYFMIHTNIMVGLAERGDNSLLRFREIHDYHDVDILFIGSSHTYRAFDPRFFDRHDLSTFNMGSNNQSPLNSYFLLRPHIDRLNPKLIIFEVYWEPFKTDGLESFLELCDNLPLTSDIWQMALATRNIRAINAILARLLEIGREPIESMAARMPIHDIYISRGFVEKDAGFEVERSVLPHRIDIDWRQFRYLERILAMAKARGIAVLLVVQPVPRETLNSITNLREVKEKFSSFAKKNGVIYADFNELMFLDSKNDFYDDDHLNQTGVEKFNVRLYDELQKRNLLRFMDTVDTSANP